MFYKFKIALKLQILKTEKLIIHKYNYIIESTTTIEKPNLRNYN